MASEMPVLPLVGSSSSRPGTSSPEASAASIIALATRSFREPVGFWPSSFAYRRTVGFGESRGSSTRGVAPTRSRREGASASATGHGGKQDDRLAVVDGRVEPVERPDVLAAEVHVHEGAEGPVLEELRPEPGVPLDQVLDDGADGVAARLELA